MVDDVLEEIRAICEGSLVSAGPNRIHLEAIVAAIRAPRAARPVGAAMPDSVAHFLPSSLEAARQSGGKALADAVKGSASELCWRQTYEIYGSDPELEPFQSVYAFTGLMGPEERGPYTPRTSDMALVGLTLQGPGTYYPPHAHEAIEVYYVIAGTAHWQQGTGTWQAYAPGSFIFHAPHVPHATRTGQEPLLTFFAWVSSLDCAVAMVTG